MALFVESYGTRFVNKTSDGREYDVLSIANKDKDGKTVYDQWQVSFVGKAKDAIPAPGKSFKFKGVVRNQYSEKTKKAYAQISVMEILTESANVDVSDVDAEADVLPW